MTGVPVAAEIYCLFSEIMNPSTINNTNITLTGDGIIDPGDYTVFYEGESFEDGAAIVKKNGPFSGGHPLKGTCQEKKIIHQQEIAFFLGNEAAARMGRQVARRSSRPPYRLFCSGTYFPQRFTEVSVFVSYLR
jgi:hypothetical protein